MKRRIVVEFTGAGYRAHFDDKPEIRLNQPAGTLYGAVAQMLWRS